MLFKSIRIAMHKCISSLNTVFKIVLVHDTNTDVHLQSQSQVQEANVT